MSYQAPKTRLTTHPAMEVKNSTFLGMKPNCLIDKRHYGTRPG